MSWPSGFSAREQDIIIEAAFFALDEPVPAIADYLDIDAEECEDLRSRLERLLGGLNS